ncbi:MAG: fibrobacter succinogenes major paralogous domain-containing protein [Dysgonamonadaceae bacterium]|jgi:uncharacterized protein (TIGR02145 family)|nr:fibrobacter succinogenes major paralogous domain-containing protein [Dysgonamonadaceae bacterium]
MKKFFFSTLSSVFALSLIFYSCEIEDDGNSPEDNSHSEWPTTTVNSSMPAGKLTFLAFNLGADKTMTVEEQIAYEPIDKYDATVYGDLYQWGRITDGHEKRTSGTTFTQSLTDIPGHGDFILGNGARGPMNWRYLGNDYLWGATKTPYDPCPDGFRVPTQEEWASIYGDESGNIGEWTGNGYKISTDGGTSYTMFLPAAGYRHYDYEYSGGLLYDQGVDGSYWSSTAPLKSEGAFLFTFTDRGVAPKDYGYRALGFSVRCVAD